MARDAFSHSQSLRVIGQRLHGAGIHAFELDKKGDEYIVRIDAGSVEGPPAAKAASDGIGGDMIGDSPGAAPPDLKFTTAELALHDKKARRNRIKPSALPDIDHLSVVLRVLGDYLDRNAAADFTILLSGYSAKVRHGGKEQIFTAQNLYDLGILMYLRHSKHASGKPGQRAVETTQLIREDRPKKIESSRFG